MKYPTVQFLKDFAVQGKKTKDGFEITTQSGQSFQGRKLVFATGIKDILPKIDGFAECWGITVVHCPYCHGYEVRKITTGILANGDGAFETAKLISNWTDELSIYTNGKSELNKDQVNELSKNNIVVIEKPIASIGQERGHIEKLKFSDGTAETLKVLYARVPFEQHSVIPSTLGCQLNEQGYIEVDMFQKTSVPGVFACGDNTTFMRSVAQAVYAGGVSGSGANMEMIQEDWVGEYY